MARTQIVETHTAIFTTANKSDLKKIIRSINNTQNSLSERAFNYIMTLVGLIHVSTGVATAMGVTIEASRLEELEDFYTSVLMRVDDCSYIRVTQKLIGKWQGDDRGYVYHVEPAYMQQY